MSSPRRPEQDPGLFDDLPLHQDAPVEKPTAPQVDKPQSPTARAKPPESPAEPLPLFSEAEEDDELSKADRTEVMDATTRPAWRPVVPFPAQISAGLIDFGIVLAVGLVVWIGLFFMGVEVDLVGSGFLALFLLPFSFLYQIFPLAFWGRTAGMARVGLIARSRDGNSLSFSQAATRWFASVLTVCLVGLPWIVTATTGRSLADRLSGSQTLPAR